MDDTPQDVGSVPEKKRRKIDPNNKPGWRKGTPRGYPGKIATTDKTARIVTLAMKGVGQTEISKCVDVNQDVVSKVLETFGPLFAEMPKVATYEDCRKQLFSAAELSALKLVVDPAKQETATLRDAAFALDRLYHAGRLERGLSTSNVETRSFGEITLKDGWSSEAPSKG